MYIGVLNHCPGLEACLWTDTSNILFYVSVVLNLTHKIIENVLYNVKCNIQLKYFKYSKTLLFLLFDDFFFTLDVSMSLHVSRISTSRWLTVSGRGFSLLRRVGIIGMGSKIVGRQTPPLVDRQTTVKTLPSRNSVCGR